MQDEDDNTQYYTDCVMCEWFGIPIIDDGAPEKCNRCLEEEIENYERDLATDKTMTDREREVMEECLEEAQDDLDYFFDRQDILDESERRFNTPWGVPLPEKEAA